ncbi:MAG: DUF2283 domain-containing protein [Candidatus Omnitrophica bacterium]|nr:DUF2283 domain-containing protein [Candidatus Omnitrophota bacterium]
MAKRKNAAPPSVAQVLKMLPHLLKFPSKQFWVDYDAEADTLYLSFEHPQQATDTRPMGDHLLLRYRGRRLVGVTVLHTSAFLKRAA